MQERERWAVKMQRRNLYCSLTALLSLGWPTRRVNKCWFHLVCNFLWRGWFRAEVDHRNHPRTLTVACCPTLHSGIPHSSCVNACLAVTKFSWQPDALNKISNQEPRIGITDFFFMAASSLVEIEKPKTIKISIDSIYPIIIRVQALRLLS